jgi:eukaryotic-like serine/threonine-protein kinase
MPREIKLKRRWILGEQIGEGGFGRVYVATGDDGGAAVVKLVPKSPGTDRELLFVQLQGVRNVVPILDSGDVGSDWAIVMPLAEMSLRQHIGAAPQFGDDEIVAILSDILTALADLDGKVVHRDLKPENILLLGGRWCLADFGISRYAEASTAPDTQKFALSPPYAAPERWRAERATTLTDVYSVGVVAFELLRRTRPFPGPRAEDFREQHLHGDPPDLNTGPTALRSIVAQCLHKAAGARPSPSDLLRRLQRVGQAGASSGGLERLREANLAEVVRRGAAERLASEARSAADLRAALFDSAVAGRKVIEESLMESITDAAPAALTEQGMRNGTCLAFGGAQIELFPISRVPPNPWEWRPPAFDVVASMGLVIRIPLKNGYSGRSHSLWFCDAREAGRYSWYETAFMISPLIGKSSNMKPFMLDPDENSAKALSNGMAELQLAWPLEPLDTGDLTEFIDRWASWFADAAVGRLRPPSSMPERETPRNWRQR